MVSDFIKGKKQFDYSEDIRKGILLHRAIDAFTDEHPVNKTARQVFQPYYRLYSSAFLDVVYDHFLARDKHHFPGDALAAFAQEVYQILDSYEPQLPPNFRTMLPYMKKYDWLFNYQHPVGIENSFAGLVRRASYMQEHETAFRLFKENYQTLQQAYNSFFPEIHQFAFNTLQAM